MVPKKAATLSMRSHLIDSCLCAMIFQRSQARPEYQQFFVDKIKRGIVMPAVYVVLNRFSALADFVSDPQFKIANPIFNCLRSFFHKIT